MYSSWLRRLQQHDRQPLRASVQEEAQEQYHWETVTTPELY